LSLYIRPKNAAEVGVPDERRILSLLSDRNVDPCFRRTLAVIDPEFLEKTPAGSKTGTVRQTLKNIIAISVSLHLEVKYRKLRDKELMKYVYELDQLTDSSQWVPPLNPFVGPSGGRQTKERNTAVPRRNFCLTTESGSVSNMQVGSL
jgi:hypothetical protein